MKNNYLVFLAAVALACAKEPDQDCSVTCIGEGLAISADECATEVLRYKRCKAPALVREPIAGEKVSVVSDGESRATIILSVGDESFTVGGPPAAAELGSAVVALSDDALLGVVQSYSDSISTCSAP